MILIENHTMLTTEQRLAARLTDLRLQQAWSLEQLSTITGISRATLSRIERGETSPTASLLNRLCVAYGCTMSRLLSEVEACAPLWIPREQQPVWRDEQSGFIRRNLSPPASAFRAELIEGELRAGALIEYNAPPISGIEQHIWLLTGELVIVMEAQRWHLHPGDCLRFHLTGSSSFHAPSEQDAHYLLVVCKP